MNNNIELVSVDRESCLYDEAINLVHESLFKEFDYSKEAILSEKENSGIHIIAVYNSKVIGHARLFLENDIGQISQVVVAEEYRGMNIGSKVINRIVDIAREFKVEYVELNSRESAIGFYERLGFIKNGDIKESIKTGMSLLNMRKYIEALSL